MRSTLLALAAILVLPAASFGLTVTMGVQGPGGPLDLSQVLLAPGSVSLSLTVTVQANADLSGVQYAFLATKDGGPANGMFQQMDNVDPLDTIAGTSPFVGPTHLETGAADANGQKGAFDLVAPAKFAPGDYTTGYTAVATFAASNPELVFRNSGESKLTVWSPNPARLVTYAIDSVGSLAEGKYVIYLGDKNNLGYKGCNQADGCVDVVSSTSYTIDVLPEPATALLVLGFIPFLRRRSV